jgi:hypothetical protein
VTSVAQQLVQRILTVTLDAGTFKRVELSAKTGALRVALAPATEFTSFGLLPIERPGNRQNAGNYRPIAPFKVGKRRERSSSRQRNNVD